MEKHQVQLVELIVNDIGGTITQLTVGEVTRYFYGVVETPTKEDDYITLEGYEMTHFFKDALIKKESDDVKLDILKYCADAQQIRIKFSSNIDWVCYSKL